jgi:AcrR family transcriptional regulator
MNAPAAPQNSDQEPGPQDTASAPAASTPAARAPITRGQRARERVLRAALDVLADEGVPGFTMEAVARRAGASKATVYRHWSSRGTLLIDAMDLGFQPLPLPATGQLRTDLVELLSGLEALLCNQPYPRLTAAFIDGAERDPTLRNLHAELIERRRAPARQILARARERGEIPPDTDLDLAIDLLGGPLFYRRFIVHQAFPEDYISTLVDLVLDAIGHTPPGPPEPTP